MLLHQLHLIQQALWSIYSLHHKGRIMSLIINILIWLGIIQSGGSYTQEEISTLLESNAGTIQQFQNDPVLQNDFEQWQNNQAVQSNSNLTDLDTGFR
jgi:hypothetical protein